MMSLAVADFNNDETLDVALTFNTNSIFDEEGQPISFNETGRLKVYLNSVSAGAYAVTRPRHIARILIAHAETELGREATGRLDQFELRAQLVRCFVVGEDLFDRHPGPQQASLTDRQMSVVATTARDEQGQDRQ